MKLPLILFFLSCVFFIGCDPSNVEEPKLISIVHPADTDCITENTDMLCMAMTTGNLSYCNLVPQYPGCKDNLFYYSSLSGEHMCDKISDHSLRITCECLSNHNSCNFLQEEMNYNLSYVFDDRCAELDHTDHEECILIISEIKAIRQREIGLCQNVSNLEAVKSCEFFLLNNPSFCVNTSVCEIKRAYSEVEKFVNGLYPDCLNMTSKHSRDTCNYISYGDLEGCNNLEVSSLKILCLLSLGEFHGFGDKVCEKLSDNEKQKCLNYFLSFKQSSP